MGSAAVPLLVGSSIIGAMGSIQSGNATNAADKYNAELATQNATIASQNATWAGQAGEAQAGIQEQKTRAQLGSVKANQAASGVDVNSGSAANVQASVTELGNLDANTIRSNAARTAYGYETQATSETAQSQLDISAGQNAQTAGYVGAGTSLLGGLGKAAEYAGSTGMFASATPTWGDPNYTTNQGTIAGGI